MTTDEVTRRVAGRKWLTTDGEKKIIPTMKLWLLFIFLLVAEFFFVSMLLSTTMTDSQEKAELVYQLSLHPDSEMEARLRTIHKNENVVDLALKAFLFICTSANGWGIFVVARKIRKVAA